MKHIVRINDSAHSRLEDSLVAINTGLRPVFEDTALSGLDNFSLTRDMADQHKP